jgi:hypothetical protein
MLTILALGHLTLEQIKPLQPRFGSIELIDMHMPREAVPADHGAEINRAIAAAANPWILILREREMVGPELAAEIRQVTGEPAQAWGFRIVTQAVYEGKPLLLERGSGEIRLVHRRHGRFDARSGAREMKVEGTVIRLRSPLRLETFASAAEHAAFLRARGVPHSALRRLLIFTRNAMLTGAWRRSRSTLRYLWIEAGFDLAESAKVPESEER